MELPFTSTNVDTVSSASALFGHWLDTGQCHLDVFAVQCLEAWEEVIPKIQRTDVISDDASRTSPKSSGSVRTSS